MYSIIAISTVNFLIVCSITLFFHFLANPNTRVSIRVQRLILDTTDPNLVSFNVNLNSSLLVLNFDEPVVSASFFFASFTFQNSLTILDDYSFFSLSNGTILSPNGIQVTVKLFPGDVNSIQQLGSLFTSKNTSFISHTNSAFFDLSGNTASPISNSSALITSMYLSDTNQPVLNCYSLDMNTGFVLLTFNEVVNISSIYFPGLSFQRLFNISGDLSFSYSLTNMSYLNQTHNDIYVRFYISEYDLNLLKMQLIGLSSLSAFLTISSLFISDMNGNFVFPLLDGINAFAPCNYYPDSTPPSLSSFSINLNVPNIILTFTETINVYSIRPYNLVLSSDQLGSIHFSFSSSTISVTQASSVYATLNISSQDFNEIQRLTSLAISLNSSFIYYSENSFLDVFSNGAIDRSQQEAVPVSTIYTIKTQLICLRVRIFLYTGFLLGRIYYSKLPLNRTRLLRNDRLYRSEFFPLEPVLHRNCSLYNKIRLFRNKIQVPWTSIKRE